MILFKSLLERMKTQKYYFLVKCHVGLGAGVLISYHPYLPIRFLKIVGLICLSSKIQYFYTTVLRNPRFSLVRRGWNIFFNSSSCLHVYINKLLMMFRFKMRLIIHIVEGFFLIRRWLFCIFVLSVCNSQRYSCNFKFIIFKMEG